MKQLNKGVGIRVLLRFLATGLLVLIATPHINKQPPQITPVSDEVVRVQLIPEILPVEVEKQTPLESAPVPGSKEDWMTQAGIPTSDWAAVDYIVTHESAWCPLKWEGDIGFCPTEFREKYSIHNATKGYGLCQSTPAVKMASIADDWITNPITQLKWCYTYMQAYGSAVEASNFKRCLGTCYSSRINASTYKHTTWF